ncbi:MAG TPA: hypothetical protein VNH64_10200, partial [Parvularculaceae bacterium]|nr:hypothetical protein [Parvularculaceae bacterium]
MTTLFYSHQMFAAHQVPEGHPENARRHAAVEQALAGEEYSQLLRREAPLATAEQINRVHDDGYRRALSRAAPEAGLVRLDPDTWLGPSSMEAAMRAAGAACAAVD